MLDGKEMSNTTQNERKAKKRGNEIESTVLVV